MKAKSLVVLIGILFLATVVGCAHAPAVDESQVKAGSDPKVSIQEGRLDNGLKVLVLEDHSAPVATVQVWYRVGSRNEQEGLRGIAHLFEHMMFKGSESVGPEDHARIIDAVGGSENAFTSDDVTAYHDTVPSDRLALAMELEAERMGRLRLDETHFFKEREVVKEELRLRSQNNPHMALFEKFRSVAYTTHPYKYTAIGALEDLDRMTLQDLRSFYQTYYAPNNAVLVVVGDVAFSRVMVLAQKFFGSFPAQTPPPKVVVVEPEQKELRREEFRFPTQLPVVIGGYKIPAARHKDSAALEVVGKILGGGRSSRIHKKLVREKKLAAFAGAWNWKMKDPGLFLVFAGFMQTPSQVVEEALVEEVERLGKQGPLPRELDKAKNQLTADYIFGLTSIWKLGVAIGQAELVEGDYRYFLKGASVYDKVTAEDVKAVITKYLNRNRLTMVTLLPPAPGEQVEKAAGKKHAQAEQEVTSWPTHQRFAKLEAASSEPIQLPPIARKTLSNGLKLVVIEMHDQPVVYFNLTVSGGKILDPKGRAGLANLLGTMLTRGTKTRSADQIAMEVESLGGSLSGTAFSEFFNVQGRFLVHDFAKGLALFADVVRNPTFAPQELAKVRPQMEAGVRVTKDNPISLAFENLSYLVYGYEHPLGRPISLATLSAVKAEDLVLLYRQAFMPRGSILTVVGDVDADKALGALDAAFGSWTNVGEVAGVPADPAPLKGRIIRMVDKPDLTQSTLALGHLGISRLDPDYFSLLLGNYTLGSGGFSSRLMTTIRAKGGKTYGAGSWFFTGKGKGPFGAYTFTRNSETKNTLDMLLEEIEKICKEGITADELQAAKNNLAGSYVLNFETPAGVAEQISSAEFYGQGEDWVRNYRKQVISPTLDEVNTALSRHLDPENLALVVVGKADAVMEQVAKFGIPIRINYLDPVPDEERLAKDKPKKGK